jgi:putative hydrolase of the HAD superfamily
VGVASERASVLAGEVRHAYLASKAWSLFEDVLPALDALKRAGWDHAILSNHVPELYSLVETLGIRDHFVKVFSSAAIGFEKPNERAFRYALDSLGSPRRVWMVGDSYSVDILGARRVGLPSILVRNNHPDAEHQCVSLLELMNVVAA